MSRPGALLLCVKYQAAARIAVPAVFAANLLLPAAHVVYGFELPVRSFRQELAAWREPPNVVNAAFYVLQGRQCFRGLARAGAGAREDAVRDLEMALQGAGANWAYRLMCATNLEQLKAR